MKTLLIFLCSFLMFTGIASAQSSNVVSGNINLSGDINGSTFSSVLSGSNSNGVVSLNGTVANLVVKNTFDNGLCPVIVTLICPVITKSDINYCSNSAPGLSHFVNGSYSRHAVISFPDGSSLTLDGSADLASSQFNQTINGTVPPQFTTSSSNVTLSPLSFQMIGVNANTIQYSGTFTITIDGTPYNVSITSTYTYSGGLPMTQPQTFNIVSPSWNFSGNILSLSQNTFMCY